MRTTAVYLERGATKTFAVAIEWPGWCRQAKTSEMALVTLEEYRTRYGAVVSGPFTSGPLEVIAVLDGTATTDFGAPDAQGPWDESGVDPTSMVHQGRLLRDCWSYFDDVLASAPSGLRKGLRGGGRDRDAVADHVRESERTYCSKMGVRVPPRTPWPEQREIVESALRAGSTGATWPSSYALRRVAWHVLDHAWEIEDRSH